MKTAVVSDDEIKNLDKLEHKINLGIKSVGNGSANILTALHEIKNRKLFLLRGCRTIRDYILKMDIPGKLNLHISSVFMKLQIIDYAKEYQLDYEAVQEIGEAKFKTLVQTGSKIGVDVSLADLKKHKLIEIEHMLRGGKKATELEAGGVVPVDVIETMLSLNLSHVKRMKVNDQREEITIQLMKGNFTRYFPVLREFDRVTFEHQ